MYGTGYYAVSYYGPSYYVGRSGVVAGATLFTYETLIAETRTRLKDTDPECYRYSDALLISVLNRGLNDLNRIRPDAWYTFYGIYPNGAPEITDNFLTLPGQVNWEADFQPDIRFYPAMVDYVTGFVHMMEDEYVNSGAAAAFLNRFRTLVLNV